MYNPPTKQGLKKVNQSFNQHKIQNDIFRPIVFDPKLTSNPFLKSQSKFHYLVHKIKGYNKLVLSEEIDDKYEMMVFAKLFTLLSSISNIETREDQVLRLNEVHGWFQKQEKLIKQRVNQGDVRYKVTTHDQVQNQSRQPELIKIPKFPQNQFQSMLPTEVLRKEAEAFQKKWRTTHKQMEIPTQRIKQYKRKIINLQPIVEMKTQKKAPKVIFPKMGRYTWVKQFEIDENAEVEGDQNIQNPQSIIENQNKPEENKEGEQNGNPDQPQQDVGLGLGEPQQEEPQEEEQQQELDKLAPRLKSFIFQGSQLTKQQQKSHVAMHNRYLKIQESSTKKKLEETQFAKIMHQWGLRKSLIDKNIMRKIQDMGMSPRYSFSYEEPEKQEKLSSKDEKAFGLAKTMPIKEKKPSLDMSNDFALPNIGKKDKIYEKTIKTDRLKSLKSKFGKMLNLKDVEGKKDVPSICNSVPKKLHFSQILQKYSKGNQRIAQLDEAISLKEKLARNKVELDARTLSMSMCAPEDQQNLPANIFPSKDLPNNPFWVEPAKKKKKK